MSKTKLENKLDTVKKAVVKLKDAPLVSKGSQLNSVADSLSDWCDEVTGEIKLLKAAQKGSK